MSITNILISYYIEVLNAMTSVSHLSCIYVYCFQPLSFFAAQLVYIFLSSCFSLIAAIGSAISCIQMFYVIKFDLLFSLDPYKIGWWTFCILSSIIFLPGIAVGVYCSYHGRYVDGTVSFLTGEERTTEGLSFLSLYTICWTVLFLSLSSAAFVFVPLIFKNRQLPSQAGNAPQRAISLQRYLLGSFGFLLILIISLLSVNLSDNKRLIPTVFYFIFVLFMLLLAYHLTEKDARSAARRYIFSFFNIEHSNDLAAVRAVDIMGSNLGYSLSSAAAGNLVVAAMSNSFPATRQIMVASVAND
jgi:hypothetical protein